MYKVNYITLTVFSIRNSLIYIYIDLTSPDSIFEHRVWQKLAFPALENDSITDFMFFFIFRREIKDQIHLQMCLLQHSHCEIKWIA